MLKNKTITLLITFVLLIIIAIPIASLPKANAHTPSWNIPSFAYVSVAPNPVGVGQKVMIFMWVDTPMPSAATTNDIRRHDYKLTITKPDRTTETQQWPIIDDTTGIEFYPYTPSQIGTYALAFEYKGQTYTWSGTYQNDNFMGTTASTTFTVQAEQLPSPITLSSSTRVLDPTNRRTEH